MANDATPFLVKALYAFKGKNNDELNFRKGDVVTLTQVLEGGWWEGTLNGVTGWFPSNYVKEYKPDSSCDKPFFSIGNEIPDPPSNRQESMKIYRNVVLKDMIDSERSHVGDLQNLVKLYLHPLERAEVLSTMEYGQLVGNLEQVIECHRKLLSALEDACSESMAVQQRVGGAFMQHATQLKSLHSSYCANHPRAVTVLEKYRDELSGFVESNGAPAPGIMVLTTGLSKAFRRLEKYPGMLQELERHMEESHADRGDTQRAIHIYREIASSCLAVRRQREMELEVLSGSIRGWEGEDIGTLGDIVLMTSLSVWAAEMREKRDRYFVLFPYTLVILSVSPRMSAFVYEGKLPLSGISVSPLEDTDGYHNAFEVTGSMIERIIASCTSQDEMEKWVETLRQHIWSSRPSLVNVSSSPSHTTASTSSASSSTSKPLISAASTAALGGSSMTQDSRQSTRAPTTNGTIWTMSCLRPAPPLRPSLALGPKDDVRRSSSRPNRRKDIEKSHNEDAQLLRVIEAYCTSAKTRYTVNSVLLDSPQVLIAEEEKIIVEETSGSETVLEQKSLVDTVYALKDQVKQLKRDVSTLSRNVENERRGRKRLEEVLRKQVFVGRDDVALAWDD